MALSNAQRQARYRKNTRERADGYTARLNTEVAFAAKSALKCLSLWHGVSQREMLERLIDEADKKLGQSLSEEEYERYSDLILQPLRSNDK